MYTENLPTYLLDDTLRKVHRKILGFLFFNFFCFRIFEVKIFLYAIHRITPISDSRNEIPSLP